MTEGQTLFAILCLLYLSECVLWTDRFSVVLWKGVGRTWHAILPSSFVGNARGGAVWIGGWPAGRVFHSHLLPVSFSPDGICSFISQTCSSSERPAQPGTFIAYPEIRSVETHDSDVVVNGTPFVHCVTVRQADFIRDTIIQVREAKISERDAVLRRRLAETFDLDAATQTMDAAGSRTRGLRYFCVGFLACMFVAAPLAGGYYGFARVFVPVVLLFLACAWTAAIGFHRVHRVLEPRDRGYRGIHVFKMVVCPPAAIRAADAATLHVTALYHPAVLAFHCCERPEALRWAGRWMRDLRFPIRIDLTDPRAVATERWHRETLGTLLAEFLRGRGLADTDWNSPPARQGPDIAGYCPRCLGQFTTAEGECPDCPGVLRLPFDGGPATDRKEK